MTVEEINRYLNEAAPSVEDLERLSADSRTGAKRLVQQFTNRQEKDRLERERLAVMYSYERAARENGFTLIAGVDEAGRGPLAGPVVAGAVILPEHYFLPGLNDSKKLTPRKREELYRVITRDALAWSVGIGEVHEIDSYNILAASKLAMGRALAALPVEPDFVLLDALELDGLTAPQLGVIGGDRLSASIAAASIVAKVTRDRWMCEMDKLFPGYGFAEHKGYPTPEHREAIARLGASGMHRKSFLLLRPEEESLKELGQKGEELAVSHLEQAGYTILEKNWRCERGEIDVIVKDGKALVFVEVKTRKSNRFGSAAEAVDARKQARLRLLARHYIHETGTTAGAYRFDVVTVDAKQNTVTHLKNCF